jgi:hypothetical protein
MSLRVISAEDCGRRAVTDRCLDDIGHCVITAPAEASHQDVLSEFPFSSRPWVTAPTLGLDFALIN